MTDVDIKIKDVTIENNSENSGAMVGTNTGSITLVQGMQYPEVRALCQDLISDEIARYRETALEEAKRRDNQLLSTFAEKLAKEHFVSEIVQKAFTTPAMQIDYQEAQKAYIKSGTPELEEILSDMLVRRVQESERTLLQITLSEAIKAASILLPCQMAALALRFILCHARRTNISNDADFISYCTQSILPIYKNACRKKSEFQHLDFSGCGQISVMSNDIDNIFCNTYKGLFAKGFTDAAITKDSSGISLKDKYPRMFIRCITDRTRWQIGVMDEDVLQAYFQKHAVEISDQSLFSNLFSVQHMSEKETKEQIIKWIPEMRDVFNYWEQSDIKSLQLSSVGIVLGVFYARLITGEEFDLNIWI